ncbi:MAG: sigma-54 dependent transcriptional regulator, partial [Holophagales bacterium]|nr:sigma-54 dependent transcriptional regulator [Holophagales bacterium]
ARLLDSEPGVPVLAVLDGGDPQGLFQLLERGLDDFVRPPLTAGAVLPRIWRCLETAASPELDLEQRVREKVALRRLVGQSPEFLEQTRKIPLLARCDVSVLICGETGTGKEVFARAIHYLSPRAEGPFVPVNCGAIPDELVENELFGHERGAFTGDDSARPGLVEEASGGTLFLDEVDSLPPRAQVKLLRFLQEHEYRRLGSTRVRRIDVRILAASNADMESALAAGRLRPDLYYRLNVVPICLPPLRRRRQDIPLLALHFLSRYARQHGRSARAFSDEAMAGLVGHDWPGNVRELEHVVQCSVVLAEGRSQILADDSLLPRGPGGEGGLSFKEAKARAVATFERGYLEGLLARHGGNVARAARAARKHRRAVFELIRKHGIDVERYRVAGPSADRIAGSAEVQTPNPGK